MFVLLPAKKVAQGNSEGKLHTKERCHAEPVEA